MLVKTSIEVAGFRGSRKGLAIVDTGASLTLLDEIVARDIGVRMTGRELSLTVADGHEVKGLLAIVDKLRVEDEELPGAHVAVISFPERLRDRLSMLNVDNWVIVGLATLEILGLTPNVKTGKLEKVGVLAL
jgi:predicted aspartyl protease